MKVIFEIITFNLIRILFYRAHYDAVFELVSILQNAAFWYMKHAAKVSAQEE